MQAIGMHAMARRIVRFSQDHKTRLYYAASICLLVAAAGLRFHDLSEHYLWSDEAVAANNSRGTFSETISNTRYLNSSPILYPLVLYAVQKVESTIFSVRVVPAMASVLTVAVMLFLLPRLGVARGAAFLAGLLATLSIAAIEHAQDAREYSIDALLAVLMLAGLLRYLRGGKKALLCASLFVAPLVQYGLVLFGAAVIGAAVVAPRVSGQERRGIGGWLKRRLDLVAPCGFFLAAGTFSYLMTLRYQWREGGFGSKNYLSAYYYQEKFDASSFFEFSIDGVWGLLTYHLPEVVAIAALPAFAILLVVAFLGKFQGTLQARAITVVFSFCIAIAVGAAVLRIYPLGDIRQGIYLGPIVFLAVGVAFHSGADVLASTTRRVWLGSCMVALFASRIVLAGVDAIRQTNLYWPHDKGEEIVDVLQERRQEEDVVYVSIHESSNMIFHQKTRIGKVMVHGKTFCRRLPEQCFQEMIAAIILQAGIGRLWLVFKSSRYTPWNADPIIRFALGANVSIEHVVSDGFPSLYMIEDTESLIQIDTATYMLKYTKPILPRNPSIRSTFDVHLSENMLIYVKEPCSAEDVQETFFVHVFPVDVDDLPARHKRHGFAIRDFRFTQHGVRSAERCVTRRGLPNYDFTDIHTGQYLVNEDGSTTHLWEGEIRFDE